MMAVQIPLIPLARTTDDEEVHLALTTAAALDTSGSRADALRWLRRAAELAADLDADERALELFRAVSDLAASIRSAAPATLDSERSSPLASGGRSPPKPPISLRSIAAPISAPVSSAPISAPVSSVPISAPVSSVPISAPLSSAPRPGTRPPPPPLPSRPASVAPPRSIPPPPRSSAPASVGKRSPAGPASVPAPAPLRAVPPPRRDDSVIATRVAVVAGARSGELVLLPAGRGEGRAWAMLVPLSSADADEIRSLLGS